MEKPCLNDESRTPDAVLIEEALGPAYMAYENFIGKITAEPFKLDVQWRYYHDGKAWLCKVQYKGKTVFWLSVWECLFKVSFYFSQRHAQAVEALGLDEGLLKQFRDRKPIGRLIPLVVEVHTMWQLDDIYTLIEFKKKLK